MLTSGVCNLRVDAVAGLFGRLPTRCASWDTQRHWARRTRSRSYHRHAHARRRLSLRTRRASRTRLAARRRPHPRLKARWPRCPSSGSESATLSKGYACRLRGAALTLQSALSCKGRFRVLFGITLAPLGRSPRGTTFFVPRSRFERFNTFQNYTVIVVLISGEQLRALRRGGAVSESAFPPANLAGPVRGCRRVGPAGAGGPARIHRRGRKESRHDY